MTGPLWIALGFLGTFGMTVIGDMVSEEVRDRLDHLPHAILSLATRRLDPSQRITVYEEEWLPELTYILKGDEARPIMRLIHGTRYALGILVSASRTADYLNSAVPPRHANVTRGDLNDWSRILESGPAFLRLEQRANWLADEHGLSDRYAAAVVHEYEVRRRLRRG